MDRGGIPASNFWAFVGDSNGLGKGVLVLERVHSNSAYNLLISIFISSLVCFSFKRRSALERKQDTPDHILTTLQIAYAHDGLVKGGSIIVQ